MCSLSMLQCCLYFRLQSHCKPNAELSKLACMSYAEVKPDFAVGKDTTSTTRNPNFLGHLISQLESLPHLRMDIQPFIYGHFSAFSTREKKMKSGYNILSLADSQKRTKQQRFASPKMLQPPHLFTAGSNFPIQKSQSLCNCG